MKEINKQIQELLKKEKSNKITSEYRKLIGFIDAAISQAFSLSGDDRAQFLVKNMLNMRDFLSAETIEENFKEDICKEVVSIITNETNKYEWIKKKEELKEKLEEEDPKLESLLEIDPKTS